MIRFLIPAALFAIVGATSPASADRILTAVDREMAKWPVIEKTDLLYDSLDIRAATNAPGGGYYELICDRNGLFAYFQYNDVDILPGSTRLVRWRVDNGPVMAQDWNTLPDGPGVYIRDGIASGMARDIMKARERLIIDNENGQSVFLVENINQTVGRVLGACVK